MSTVYIIMGVSGSGKTTIGQLLSSNLGIPFYDADDFHPETNIEKMSNGIPLEDIDRWPWLHILHKKIRIWTSKNGAVLACSALKESYRSVLSKDHSVQWIVLEGNQETIATRIEQREHFMPRDLLQSQFDTLEVPSYGIHISIENSPEEVVQQILNDLNLSEFGILGLGVMGKSLAKNCLRNDITLSVYNRDIGSEAGTIETFIKDVDNAHLQGYTELDSFVKSLRRPRKILLMVAAPALDRVLEQLVPLLDEEDIVIDGGNSFFKDSLRRAKTLQEATIYFVDMGVSGGEQGALLGPSLMPGGTSEVYFNLKPILELIAAKDRANQPCVNFIGGLGSGHFVKMVHNGIEYAEMQLLAELYSLFGEHYTYEEMASLFEEWNQGDLRSFLLEATISILKYKEDNTPLLDLIRDEAAGKGTGAWTGQTAMELGIAASMTIDAVNSRYISMLSAQRTKLSDAVQGKGSMNHPTLVEMKEAYAFARIINHHQGFELIKAAAQTYNWDINLSELARIWTQGCIIRSALMEELVAIFKTHDGILDTTEFVKRLESQRNSITALITSALTAGLAVPCLSSALNYWLQISTKNSPANLIQAQRDFFGSHGYKRTDTSSNDTFTTNWTHG